MAVDTNDFEIALGVVFDKAAEQQAIAEFLSAAKKIEQEGEKSTKRQIADAQKASARRLADQLTANRKWSEAERKQYAAIKSAAEAFFRASAQARREASQTERREFERQSKQQLQDRRAANQRLQAIVAAGLKDAADRRRSAQRIAEQDNASGLRRFEAQEKEAARNLERLAKQQAAAEARLNAARLAEAARADRARITQQTLATKEQAALARREGEKLAQQQKQTDRLLFNAEQESSARRIARAKAFYSTLASVARSGAQATQNVVTSFFRRRENAARQVGDRITNIDRSTTTKSTSVIRQQLDAQNREYTTAAQKRLRIIETNADRERRVITANAVKQAEAQTAIQQRTSTGLIGAAAGRSAVGGGLQSLLYGAAGLYGIKKLIDASSSLAESQSKVRVVFGDSAKAIFDFASNSAKAIGESEQATLEALGTYGNLFQSFGVGRKLAAEYSVGLVKLASDLASFNNTSVQDAIEALRSGLTGETEPLKRYGIAINETLLKQEAARLGLVKSSVSQTELTRNTIAAEKAQKAAAIAASKYGANSIQAREAMAKYDAVVEKVGKSLKGKLPAQLDSAQKAQAAYSLIMQRSTLAQGDFNRTQEGFANQSRIVTARLKDLQAAAGNGLLPIALALAYTFNKAILPALEKSTEAVSGFIRNIATGEGVWKVVRDGLTGIAVGLGALLAVKAGVEVVGLLGAGLKLLGGAVVAAPVVAALVALGAVGYTLYRNAPGIRSFFDSLVEGTKNWYLVGYRISEPIKNLSKIVLLQSSFGAAARVIVGGLGLMQRGVEQFRRGFGTGGLEDALRYTLAGLGDALSPARDVVADGLKVIFERGRDFLTTRALPILGEARLNVGSFLLPLLGLTGGDGGVVSRVVTTAITKLFLGSIASFNPNLPAAQLGAKGREIIDRAIAVAQRSAVSVREFFASLFGGDVDFDSFASTLGGRLNDAIGGAFDRLKERLGPINDLLASIGGAIASGFTSYVLPKLIELPRIVGRFISKTVFSEEFLKAISIGAAAIAGTALVVAGQFVRGFIEGLIARRGDIAKTVLDIITFTAKAVLGTGNPFAILTGTIIAAFAGAKVLGAISTLRGQFRIAAAGMTGDAAKLQQAVADAAQAKQPASTSKVGNAALAISDGYRKAETVVRRIGATIENAGAKTIKLGGLIDGVGNRLLKLPLDATTNAAGRLVSGTTGRFVKDTTASLNSLQRRAGEFANKYAGLLSTPLVKAGAALQSFPRTVQSKLQAASSGVKNFASALSSTVPDGVSKAQLAVQVGASAMTGYMTGLAETSQAKAIGILASVGEVAAAFAVDGPVVGGIAAVATAVTFFWGESTKAGQKARDAQKVIAANLTASAEEIGAAFRAAFKDQGGATSGEGRAAGVLRIIRDLLDVNSKGAKDFADRFKTDMNDVATAAGLPRKEFERFTSAVIDRNVSEVLEGNADAIKRFSNQTRIAGRAAVTSFLDSIASKEDSATFERILQSSGADIIDLQKKVQTGAISIGEFRDRMVEIGFTTQDADRAYKAYKESLTEAIGNTAGGQFLRNLPGQLYASVHQQAILNEANAELQSRLEGFGPVAERFSSAWGRIKAAIDKAKEAYLNWVDASTGRQLSRAEAISGLFGAAQDFTTPQDGENKLLAEARQTRARAEAQRVIAGQLQELAKRAAGDPAKLNALINDFFNELRAGTNDKETIDFFNQIQYLTADPQSIQILVDSQPAIEGLNGLETQIRTLLQLPENSPLRVGLEKARNFDESKMLVTASLTELAKQDPRIQAYIEKNGGFDTVVASIAADAGFIDSLKAKAEADLDADPFTKKKNLITAGLDELEKRETALRIRPFLVDPTGDWTNLFGIIGLDLGIGSRSAKVSLGSSAPPGLVNTERRWGGVDSYAFGGVTQAHVQRHQRIKYAEPETGGEAYVPRRGIKARSEAITHQIASWLGGKFIPSSALGGTTAMAAGGVVTSTPTMVHYDRPSEVEAAGRRIADRVSEILIRIEWIMSHVSKSMSKAEARAAVLDATAAHHGLGAAAGAKWDEALTRFFAGGRTPMAVTGPSFSVPSSGPTLPSPSRPGSSPTANTDFTKPQVVIHRNLTVEANIAATQPIPTALEVVRRARDSDFLAGGPALEMEYVG